ncbi:MAG: PAS domain S-box protein [Synergistota bacterium]|nr:PAS domain S-box protein [Synergistota bacterium]
MKRAKSHHQATSESFIEMLFNFFPEGAVITDEDEAIIEANPEFRRMFGCESKTIKGKKVNDVVARRPACGKTAPGISETLARTGRIYLETERCGRDGRPFPVAIHVARIDIPEGGPCFLGVYRDLSCYEDITRSFFESELRFREMCESAPFGLYRTTPDGRILDANPALVRMLGYKTLEELQNSRNLEEEGYEPAYSREQFKQDLERDGFVRQLESAWTRRDGGQVFVRETAWAVRDECGDITHYEGMVEDITGIREAENSLREARDDYRRDYAMFRLMADNMPDLVWAKDRQKRFIFANRATCNVVLNACDTEEPIGKTDRFFAERERSAHPENPEWHTFGETCRDSDEIVMESGETGRFDENGNIRGKFLFLDVYKAPMFNADGDMVGVVGSGRVVTRERELENQKQKSEKALQETVSKLRRTQKGIFHTIAKMLEMRDPYTSGHQERTARLAVAIGREMELDDKKLEALEVSAMVHDIGKLEVPAEILSKPGKLSEIEFSLLKGHPESAGKILGEMDYPWPVDTIVLQHHERLDGSGYPHGLAGDDICMEARILAVADVVEAMCSHRPYRPAKSLVEALDEIRNGRGVKFDADAVDACVSLFESERFSF